MLRRSFLVAFAVLLGPLGFPASSHGGGETRAGPPNVLLIVVDDMGVDRLGAYCVAPDLQPPCTPHIDALAARGLVFERAFGNPMCSPTRAQILTGRHGFRTGVGGVVDVKGSRTGLSTRERILPEVLAGYDSSMVGKWHLADPRTDGLQHPLDSGFRYYAGALYNLRSPPLAATDPALCPRRGTFGYGYYNWVKTCAPAGSGALVETCSSTYATTDTADEAIARARAMRPPWFLEVAFNAPHTPFETPPAALCVQDERCGLQIGSRVARSDVELSDAEISDMMVEALDHELGRTLAGIRAVDPDVVVVLIGDNGTDETAARPTAAGCFADERVKGSLFQGGIRVPLIIAGPGVVPGRCDALVSAVDLFATVAELAGQQIGTDGHPEQMDSISLVPYLRGRREPLRRTVYSENFRPNFAPPPPGSFAPETHLRAVQDERFKLVRWTTARGLVEELFFDLEEDPCEQRDLAPDFGPADSGRLTPLQAAHLRALQEELVLLGVF